MNPAFADHHIHATPFLFAFCFPSSRPTHILDNASGGLGFCFYNYACLLASFSSLVAL